MELILPSQALRKHFVGADILNKKAASDLAKETEAAVSYHAYLIGDVGILLPQDTISEVVEKLAYCQLPNTTAVLYGMANLRGNIIPIFDLHELFGFVIKGNTDRYVLIVGRGENTFAVLVDELPKRIDLTTEQLLPELPSLPKAIKPYIKNCYHDDGIKLEVEQDFYSSLSEYLQ